MTTFQDAIKKVNIAEADILEWRKAKFYQSCGEDSSTYPGYIALTKDKLFFVCEKGFLRPIQLKYEIAISRIDKISKVPLIHQFYITANTADQGSGLLKKMFGMKNARVSIEDGKTFIEKLREQNPAIQV